MSADPNDSGAPSTRITRPIFVDGVPIGKEGELVVMAGPCAVESKEQVEIVARVLSRIGIPIMRGGAFKPRTSPHTFQGLGEKGLILLRDAADRYGLRIVSEVMDTEQFALVRDYAHLIQVGARSMYNTCLLGAIGESGLPVLIKRAFSSPVKELLLAAEHLTMKENRNVLLCERGIRTFETATRFTLDLSMVPVLKESCTFPIVVDPSHAAGDAKWVPHLARSAVAAGADALLIEVHPDPIRALCDPRQALTLRQLETLVPELYDISGVLKKQPRPSVAGGVSCTGRERGACP